ncbi:M28 family metallopeptidase [Halomarina oriensis]|uniref:Carboxypeptidase Q n=1 Tax=Halomarina oriensis TaxID=671145 RepID=A0A6B0GG68_9EURY|nr:M28 family metallopeptidase [Halomarina oriensis]MWG33694.1 M28 family peptidase [Halomarina oriensis]
MDDDTAAALGRAWRDDFPWQFLTRLTELGDRMGGSPGERRAAELVSDALCDVGADPDVEPFEMNRWTRGDAELAVRTERDGDPVERSFETIALPYSAAGDVTGPLVDVGYGTPDEIADAGDELAGGIAVASTDTPPEKGRFVHRMEKFGHAAAAGAKAFVFANHVPGQLPPTGSLRFDAEAAMPGVGVSTETGDWLTEYAAMGAEATVRVSATTERGESRNIVGTLGPDTDEEVVVVAHFDAHDIAEGAQDNGCGITTVLTAARLLAAMDLDCRVRLAGVGCEETGLMGAEALADSLDRLSVKAVVNVDGAGRARNLRAYAHGHDEVRAFAERVVEDAGQPLAVTETPHPYSDHWPFLRAGVPALQLHSQPPAGAERGRGWGHTHADTRDKVEVRDVREHAMLTALLVAELTREAAFERVDAERLAEQLREADAERGMRAAELWPDEWD